MMFDNLETMRNFRQTKLDTNNKNSLEAARGLILKNREFMSRFSCLFDEANKILKNETGLDMEILFDGLEPKSAR